MNVEVRLFAQAKEVAGVDSLALELPENASVSQLREALVDRVPAMTAMAQFLLIAVGNDYADDSVTLPTGVPIACFPPVSGG